jgi:pyruvate dehydrogenase E2 component (dihydrolipoamide acetyltransferase)
MAVEVTTMPRLGLTMSEGEQVTKGQPLFEIETDKATVEAEATAGGLLRISVEAGSVIPVMGVVGYLLAPGEEMPEK